MHSSRSVRHCLVCIVSVLFNQNDCSYYLPSFSNKSKTKKYLTKLLSGAKKKVVPIPYRLLVPCWKSFSWPKIETIIPGCDILYTNEFYFPPTKNALALATIHGLSYRIIPEKIQPQIVQSLNQDLSFVIKHADYLIAVSETTQKELMVNQPNIFRKLYELFWGEDLRKIHINTLIELFNQRFNQNIPKLERNAS